MSDFDTLPAAAGKEMINDEQHVLPLKK